MSNFEDFITLPDPYPEYRDELTPESARQEGYEAGVRSVLESTLAHIASIKSPTKQIESLRLLLQDQLDVIDR